MAVRIILDGHLLSFLRLVGLQKETKNCRVLNRFDVQKKTSKRFCLNALAFEGKRTYVLVETHLCLRSNVSAFF